MIAFQKRYDALILGFNSFWRSKRQQTHWTRNFQLVIYVIFYGNNISVGKNLVFKMSAFQELHKNNLVLSFSTMYFKLYAVQLERAWKDGRLGWIFRSPKRINLLIPQLELKNKTHQD